MQIYNDDALILLLLTWIFIERTEQQWAALCDTAVTAIIANYYFGDYSIDSIISETIRGANRLIKELKA